MYRLSDKEGKLKDLEVWNIATDAIINANLERDGFTIKEGYVNRPEALNYSTEEFYEILLKESSNKKNKRNREIKSKVKIKVEKKERNKSNNQDSKEMIIVYGRKHLKIRNKAKKMIEKSSKIMKAMN